MINLEDFDNKLKKALDLRRGSVPFILVIARKEDLGDGAQVYFDVAVSDLARHLPQEALKYALERIQISIEKVLGGALRPS